MEIALNKAALLTLLTQACTAAGGVTPWAKANAFTRQFVAAVMRGDEEPTEKLANALGLVRLVSYVPIAELRAALGQGI